ncbi:MAG: ABC transporter permease [Acidimicrobiia bacterium]|nr:MAG: ABC transporter permease [Acidimicrobiia bacterium]
MHPLLLTFLIFGIPAVIGLAYVFVRGSPGLRSYIVTRIALTIPMILILATVVFLVMRIIPGDPIDSALGPKGTAEIKERFAEQHGLNDPLAVQYGRFVVDIFTLDFGNSLVQSQRPIVDELGERLPATLEMVIPATLLALGLGIFLGTRAGVRRKSATDYGSRIFSVMIYAMPIFWLGLLFQLIFGVWLGWTPIAGRIDPQIPLERTTNLLVVDAIITGNWVALRSVLSHLVLPTLTLGLVLSGVFLRLTRINIIETGQEDYVAAARARGIDRGTITRKYSLKNAMIPVITLIGLQVAILLAGAVLTETVFAWPGMGRYLIQRILARDFIAVQSVIIFFALFVAVISLAVDIVYSLLDPRVRY